MPKKREAVKLSHAYEMKLEKFCKENNLDRIPAIVFLLEKGLKDLATKMK